MCEQSTERLNKLEAVADLISRIYFYGDGLAETPDEKLLIDLLKNLGYLPTTESEMITRPPLNNLENILSNASIPPRVQIKEEIIKLHNIHKSELAKQDIREYDEVPPFWDGVLCAYNEILNKVFEEPIYSRL